MVRRTAYRGRAFRRRLERGGRGRAANRWRLARRGIDRSDAPGPRARSGPRFARGANPGRCTWPFARRPVAPAQLHAAPFSAVVRILHAGRMDRDPLGRPFRDALHPYRRFRRVGPRAHADRHRRIAPPARLGRGAEPRPHVHRLGGNSRHHHRGLDAPAGPAEISRRRVGIVSRLRRRGQCRARDLAGRAISGQLPPARSG